MKIKPLKTYNVKLYTIEELSDFVDFQNLVIINDQTVTETVMQLCREYVKRYSRKDVFLIAEADLITYARSLGLTVGRTSLKKYRMMGALKNGSDPWCWSNSDGNVIYNRDKVIEFLMERKKDPYSRVIQD